VKNVKLFAKRQNIMYNTFCIKIQKQKHMNLKRFFKRKINLVLSIISVLTLVNTAIGGILLYQQNQNDANAGFVCPGGYTYNSGTSQCESIVNKQCPSGYAFQGGSGVCERSISTGDFTWISDGNSSQVNNCPANFSKIGGNSNAT
jgi:hypothetical protein